MQATLPGPVLLREDRANGVVLLRINRPAVRNALNLDLRRALAAEFQELCVNKQVRCIVLTGDERAFSAGADLREYVDATPVDVIERHMDRLWGAIAGCNKPVIAAVRGHALGGGCELAMHADIIIAGEASRFAQPEVRLGLIPGGGATQRLTRAVGKFAAMMLLMSGRTLAARDAKTLGLVSEVVADEAVLPTALELAEELATYPELALRQIKELVLASMNAPLDTGLQLERKAFQLMFSTPDKTERIRAFLK